MTMTAFNYGIDLTPISAVGTVPGVERGLFVALRAGAALTLNDVVMVDTAANNQVLRATSAGAARAIGVCRGRMIGGEAQLGLAPASGEQALIQIPPGIVTVVAGAAITRGDRLTVSAATAGRVATATALAATIAAASVDADGVTVTSTAANGAIVTVPDPVFTGDGAQLTTIVGLALETASGAGVSIRMLMR